MSDALEWANVAMEKRPWRAKFFARIASEIRAVSGASVLELGSGPGFLADAVLIAVPSARAKFVTADLKHPDWRKGLGTFNFVITMQAVHELRHKAHAAALHAQVRELLEPSGAYLVCDHYVGPDGMANAQLYMTIDEQRAALEAAGFRVTELMREGGLVLHHAA